MTDQDEPLKTPRCRIPQNEITDPRYLAAAYSGEVIAEAYLFKHAAYKGAKELGHTELALAIQKQMSVLTGALTISREED